MEQVRGRRGNAGTYTDDYFVVQAPLATVLSASDVRHERKIRNEKGERRKKG